MNCRRIIGVRVTREILKIMGAKIFLLKYNKKRNPYHKDSATGNNKNINNKKNYLYYSLYSNNIILRNIYINPVCITWQL